ncbi:helix-turn-helix domain-containing protein [Halorarius halobius]|uniref:helix-turn-helix domain-containing protein n=1 Tax=Halorarius halobius TaxID=2962671 RepID=UPI0020CEA97F|nr:helix-turn-helix domain-containing protein [Halorarius halobius]
MGDSIGEMLREDMACEGLLECFHGLKALDREVFAVLVDAEEPLTVDEIAEAVDRERSTAYRSVRRLKDTGFVRKEQVNYDQGGYYHVFTPADPDQVADEMQRMLNDWYAQMGQLIAEFREKYEDADALAVAAQD